jgi:hypothetical protein
MKTASVSAATLLREAKESSSGPHIVGAALSDFAVAFIAEEVSGLPSG